jgi:uncharacterized membrane protein
MKKALFLLALIVLPAFAMAQDTQLIRDEQQVVLARVLEVISEEQKNIPGTDRETVYQTIKAEILEGSIKGRIVEIKDDYLNLKVGEKFYVLHTIDWQDGSEYFGVQEKYRLPPLLFLVLLFVGLVVVFGRSQGARGLLSLIGSFVLIIFVLLPGILKGYSPVFLTITISSFIIIFGSYVTHGFNRVTSAAVVGMVSTVLATGLLAFFAVKATYLTGYESEEAIYLTFNSGGQIDIAGLLFGGIMIGLLGALYDAAIGQAVAVDELSHIAPNVSKKKIYERAMRMGREHIGALVDTLAIAYVGTSLPLLLLFYQSASEHYLVTINREIFATEIVRIMVGSIGLIFTVPITTIVAVAMLKKDNIKNADPLKVKEEEGKIEKISGHMHSH